MSSYLSCVYSSNLIQNQLILKKINQYFFGKANREVPVLEKEHQIQGEQKKQRTILSLLSVRFRFSRSGEVGQTFKPNQQKLQFLRKHPSLNIKLPSKAVETDKTPDVPGSLVFWAFYGTTRCLLVAFCGSQDLRVSGVFLLHSGAENRESLFKNVS